MSLSFVIEYYHESRRKGSLRLSRAVEIGVGGTVSAAEIGGRVPPTESAFGVPRSMLKFLAEYF